MRPEGQQTVLLLCFDLVLVQLEHIVLRFEWEEGLFSTNFVAKLEIEGRELIKVLRTTLAVKVPYFFPARISIL